MNLEKLTSNFIVNAQGANLQCTTYNLQCTTGHSF